MIEPCVDKVSFVFCEEVITPIILVFRRESHCQFTISLGVFIADEAHEVTVAVSVVCSDVF